MKIHGDKLFGVMNVTEPSRVSTQRPSSKSDIRKTRPYVNYEHKILVTFLTGIGLILWILAIIIKNPSNTIKEIIRPFKKKG